MPRETVRVHRETVRVHSGTVHLYSGTVHLYSGTVHLYSGTVHVRSETVHVRSDAVHVRSDAVHVRSEAVRVGSPAAHAHSLDAQPNSLGVRVDSLAVQGDSPAVRMRRAPSHVEFSIPTADTGVLLVSDSGYIVVVRPLNGLCGVGTVDPSQAFVTIVRSDGTSVGRLTAADILTKHDIDLSGGHFAGSSLDPRLASAERELLVFAVAGQERRVDLASAKLLDPKENVLSSPVVFADAAPREREYSKDPFGEMSSVHLKSEEFLSRERGLPLPSYPVIAQKALVAGPVWVEVIVFEYGEVVAVRATRLPFGLSAGAVAAVRQWRFRPLQVDGKRVKYNGEVAIHFEHEVVQ